MQLFILSTTLKILIISHKLHGLFQICAEVIHYPVMKKFIKHFLSCAKYLIWTFWTMRTFLMFFGQYLTQSKVPKVDWILSLKVIQFLKFFIYRRVINYRLRHLLWEFSVQYQQETRHKHNNFFKMEYYHYFKNSSIVKKLL